MDPHLCCEVCGVAREDDDSVQLRMCGCVLCEGCADKHNHEEED